MSVEPKLPTESELQKLSERAIVAYAVRCARRVQPLYGTLEQDLREPLDKAVLVAEAFAKGEGLGADAFAKGEGLGADAARDAARDARAARDAYDDHAAYAPARDAASAASAAAHAASEASYGAYAADAASYGARAAARDAASTAAYAAVRAALAAGSDAGSDAAARRDYEQLRVPSTVSAPDLGDPIDFDKLGPLWPEGEPEWFTKAQAEPAAEAAPEKPAETEQLPSRSDLQKLSRRAIVAYAVRCARRVQPLYGSLEQRFRQPLDEAVLTAEAFAKGERLADYATGGADAHDADAHAAYAAYAANAAAHAAHAAAHADDAAYADAHAAAADAVYAAGYADAHAAAHAEGAHAADAIGATRRDYQQLRALSTVSALDLGDPIDFNKLGPLWPEGEPAWFTKAQAGDQPCGDAELVVELEIPEGVSDEEVLETILELSLRADDLHRELGGKGLKVERLEVFDRSPVPTGVPDD